MYRSHTCGELRAANINQTVTLAGWVQKVRNLGAMAFIDLRDRYGITQIVVEESSAEQTKEAAGPEEDRYTIVTLEDKYFAPHTMGWPNSLPSFWASRGGTEF